MDDDLNLEDEDPLTESDRPAKPKADKELIQAIAREVLAGIPLALHFEGVEFVIVEGKSGPKGEKGDRGARGEAGDPGERGEMGLRGEPGRDGARGPKGERGGIGPEGAPGKAGSPGVKGDKGDTGAQGLAGLPGRDGKDGRDGIDGPSGKPGRDGKGVGLKEVMGEIDKQKAALGVQMPRPLGRASTLSIIYATETPNGVRTTFTFAQKPLEIVSDGISMIEGAGWWTWSGSVATLAVAPQDKIYGRA